MEEDAFSEGLGYESEVSLVVEMTCVLAQVEGRVHRGDKVGGVGVDLDLGLVVLCQPVGDVRPVPQAVLRSAYVTGEESLRGRAGWWRAAGCTRVRAHCAWRWRPW